MLLYSSLFRSILLYSILICFILLNSTPSHYVSSNSISFITYYCILYCTNDNFYITIEHINTIVIIATSQWGMKPSLKTLRVLVSLFRIFSCIESNLNKMDKYWNLIKIILYCCFDCLLKRVRCLTLIKREEKDKRVRRGRSFGFYKAPLTLMVTVNHRE